MMVEKKSVSQKLAQRYYENTSYMDVIEKNDLEDSLDVTNHEPQAKSLRRLIVATNITRAVFVLSNFVIWAMFRANMALGWCLIAAYLVLSQLIIYGIFRKTVKSGSYKKVIVAMYIVDICVAAAVVLFIIYFFSNML